MSGNFHVDLGKNKSSDSEKGMSGEQRSKVAGEVGESKKTWRDIDLFRDKGGNEGSLVVSGRVAKSILTYQREKANQKMGPINLAPHSPSVQKSTSNAGWRPISHSDGNLKIFDIVRDSSSARRRRNFVKGEVCQGLTAEHVRN